MDMIDCKLKSLTSSPFIFSAVYFLTMYLHWSKDKNLCNLVPWDAVSSSLLSVDTRVSEAHSTVCTSEEQQGQQGVDVHTT